LLREGCEREDCSEEEGQDRKEGAGVSKHQKNWWQEMPEQYDAPPAPQITVFPSEPTNTGILDADGNPIMRNPYPVGFLKNDFHS
jgi:hypothetical protein